MNAAVRAVTYLSTTSLLTRTTQGNNAGEIRHVTRPSNELCCPRGVMFCFPRGLLLPVTQMRLKSTSLNSKAPQVPLLRLLLPGKEPEWVLSRPPHLSSEALDATGKLDFAKS